MGREKEKKKLCVKGREKIRSSSEAWEKKKKKFRYKNSRHIDITRWYISIVKKPCNVKNKAGFVVVAKSLKKNDVGCVLVCSEWNVQNSTATALLAGVFLACRFETDSGQIIPSLLIDRRLWLASCQSLAGDTSSR